LIAVKNQKVKYIKKFSRGLRNVGYGVKF